MHIAPELIDPDADKVVRRLARHGYQAYLVGGCVRDLLLSRSPKDFDVATSATPSEIKELFRNCRIIGRRFRLAHIFFGSKIIETSTFRANPRGDEHTEDGEELLIRRDNVFGSDTEDAQRRDFTINGLFYDAEAERVIDHVGGLDDLRAGLIRTIGDPDIRFREDPVRMMRAIKFAARLGFEVEGNTFAALARHRGEIRKCAQPRVLEEVYRLLRSGAARRATELLVDTGVLSMLSPRLAAMFAGGQAPAPEIAATAALPRASEEGREEDLWAATWSEDSEEVERLDEPLPELELGYAEPDELAERRELAWNMLGQVDRYAAEGGDPSNALVLAACCAPFVVPSLLDAEVRPAQANDIVDELLTPITEQLRIARRDAERARQILLAQRRLAPERRRRGKPMALVRRDYFDESLVIYELLGAARGTVAEDASYWRRLQEERGGPADGDDDRRDSRRRRRRGGRRRRRGEDGEFEPAVG